MKKGLLLCVVAALSVGCVSSKTYQKDRADFFRNDGILDARDKKMSPAIEALDNRLKALEAPESE